MTQILFYQPWTLYLGRKTCIYFQVKSDVSKLKVLFSKPFFQINYIFQLCFKVNYNHLKPSLVGVPSSLASGSGRRRQRCPCTGLVSYLFGFSGKSCPVSVCPDFLVSILSGFSKKKLSVVCLPGRTRTRTSCLDFHCPCPPTSVWTAINS